MKDNCLFVLKDRHISILMHEYLQMSLSVSTARRSSLEKVIRIDDSIVVQRDDRTDAMASARMGHAVPLSPRCGRVHLVATSHDAEALVADPTSVLSAAAWPH